MSEKQQLNVMMDLVLECIETNKIEFLAKLILKIQNEYYEVASLATNGNFQPSWTHLQLLDYITYET